MRRAAITGSGLWTPAEGITNRELVESLSEAVTRWNEEHAEAIEAGTLESRDLPSERFIERASGVKHRYVVDKKGVLDPARLRPHLPLRGEDELGVQAEICVPAIREALDQAGRRPEEVHAASPQKRPN